MGKGKIEVTVESRMLMDRLLAEFSAEDRYEAGGILGGKGGVITVYEVDKKQKSQHFYKQQIQKKTSKPLSGAEKRICPRKI